jgi:hypothetical protein
MRSLKFVPALMHCPSDYRGKKARNQEKNRKRVLLEKPSCPVLQHKKIGERSVSP